jgi:hypothetical protein
MILANMSNVTLKIVETARSIIRVRENNAPDGIRNRGVGIPVVIINNSLEFQVQTKIRTH